MKRVIYYIGKIIVKIIGLFWWFVAVRFRAYSRNVVHNYYLQNDKYMRRLNERTHELINGANGKPYAYIITPGHGTEGGLVYYHKISWLKFQFVFWILWIWVDDDAFCDTNGEFYAQRFGVRDKYVCNGNYFDIGDAMCPSMCLWYSWLWNVRNTAYNYNYAFEHIYRR